MRLECCLRDFVVRRVYNMLMRLSRVQISNFRNFKQLDLSLGKHAVIVGENAVGKSNFLYALRLVLDSSLPDSARLLKKTDIWDGCLGVESPRVNIHLDFVDFDENPNELSLLTDYRLTSDPQVARISYSYHSESGSLAEDYVFNIYAADDESKAVSADVRRRLSLTVLTALRDAEAELSTWRNSPIRGMLDDAILRIPPTDAASIAEDVSAAASRISSLAAITEAENSIRTGVRRLLGALHDTKPKLSIVPTEPSRLFRSLRLLVDEGRRSISEASMGTSNMMLLSLKLSEFEWLRRKNRQDYAFWCIEEPEAHVHPHMQRHMFKKLFEEVADKPISLIITTHSPNIVSVTPIELIVALRVDPANGSTIGKSMSSLGLSANDYEDLKRYLDVSRAEIFFARKVIFVEGDAEEALIASFANTLGFNLDDLGITICNVGGAYFEPYVKLALSLSLPFVVITDWDPMESRDPLFVGRSLKLIELIKKHRGQQLSLNEQTELRGDSNRLKQLASSEFDIFSNDTTFEVELAQTPDTSNVLLDILDAEKYGKTRAKRIQDWKANRATIDPEQLLSIIADIGKGRLAARLASQGLSLQPPPYIRDALNRLCNA